MEQIQKLKNKLYKFDEPEEPWYPLDITEAPDETLGKLLHLYTRWKNHVSQQLSFSEADVLILKETLEINKAEALILLNSDQDLKTEYKAKEDRLAYVTQLPKIKEKIEAIAVLNATAKIQKSYLEVFEDRYSSVSREITRRQAAWNR